MTVRDPVLLDQDGEAARGSEVRVEAELRESRKLRRPVPSVGTVDEDMRVVEVNGADYDQDAVENVGEVRQPVRSSKGGTVEPARSFGVGER